jgi:hypothetical protein
MDFRTFVIIPLHHTSPSVPDMVYVISKYTQRTNVLSMHWMERVPYTIILTSKCNSHPLDAIYMSEDKTSDIVLKDKILTKITEMTEFEKLQESRYNLSAMATTLSNSEFPILKEPTSGTRILGEWKDVQCPDKTIARVLKNPNKAFEVYASQWKTKIKAIQDILGLGKVGGDMSANKEVEKLFNNLQLLL